MKSVGYLLETTLGDSILSENASVYVQVSPERYVKKRPRDVNVGDMVVYQKPYVKTTLDDVDPELTKSPRYARAKDIIHQKNAKGDHIPLLRVLLLEGLSEHDVIPKEYVSARALREVDDYTQLDYQDMALYVGEVLREHGFTRSEESIEGWLRGDVLAPKDWRIFQALKVINPKFGAFQQNDDRQGVYYNYRMYVVLRQGIMKYLNNCRGITAGEESEQGESKISLGPEYAIVFQHFMNDISQNFATARVTREPRLLKRGQEIAVRTRRTFSNGVLGQKTEPFERAEKLVRELHTDHYVLKKYVEATTEPYLERRNYQHIANRLPHDQFVTGVNNIVLPLLYRKFGSMNDPLIESLESIREGLDPRILQLAEELSEDFVVGNVDDVVSLPKGRLLSLLEALYRTHQALPREYFQYKVARPGERNDQKTKQKLRGYGFEIVETDGDFMIPMRRVFFSDFLEQQMMGHEIFHGELTSVRRLILDGKMRPSDKEYREWVKMQREGDTTSVFNASEVGEILSEYRLRDLLSLREYDFRWETG